MPRNASAAFADKAQNEGFPMISSQVRAQMPIISVVALGALVAALLLHASYALAQSSAGAPDRLYSSSATHEAWGREVASSDAAFVAPSSAAAGVVAVPPYGQKSPSFYRPFTRTGYDSHIGIGGLASTSRNFSSENSTCGLVLTFLATPQTFKKRELILEPTSECGRRTRTWTGFHSAVASG